VLAGASFAIGLSATLAQDLVPAAAVLAAPERRGKAVGSVMTGLLLGILLSRVVSGAIAERGDWRVVFFGAAGLEWTLALVCALRLPRFSATTEERYLRLLGSMLALVRKHEALRRAALAQGLVSVSFSAFWSTLALVLAAPPFELGSTWAGAFGIAGAAGAIAAPVAGGLADRRGPDVVNGLGIGIVLVSFAAIALAPSDLAVLVTATITFDLGVSLSLVSHQTIVYGIDPAARSRLNALLVTSMFVGMAAGAAIASRVCEAWGLRGVATFAACAAALALLVRATRRRKAQPHQAQSAS
jgi:predicted MFS family arabinose efflux permease